MPRPLTTFALFLPFALSILGAYAWFNTDIGRPASSLRSPASGIWLTARTNLPGYTFIPETVSDSVMKTLGTTNILSGTFYRIGDRRPEYGGGCGPETSLRSPASDESASRLPSSASETALDTGHSILDPERVTVFLASWPAGDSRGLTALQHTPDICWGGSGWKPLNLGQPSQISLDIPIARARLFGDRRPEYADRKGGLLNDDRFASQPRSPISGSDSPASGLPPPVSITFDFRIFQLPNDPNCEAVAWCALAGGQPLIGTAEWGRESISRDSVVYYFWSRAVQLKQILHAAQNRLPVRQEKQFVRYSVPLESNGQSGMETLCTFGPAWLNEELL